MRDSVIKLLAGLLARDSCRQAQPNSLKQKSVYKKPYRRVEQVFIHCSDSDRPEHDDVSVIRDWHLARNFSDVGYHYFIQNDGTIQPGRGLNKIPAAQKGHNTLSVAICLHGRNKFTKAQKQSLVSLCREINKEHDGGVTFHGHKEVSNKTCPNFNYKRLLKLNSDGKLGV